MLRMYVDCNLNVDAHISKDETVQICYHFACACRECMRMYNLDALVENNMHKLLLSMLNYEHNANLNLLYTINSITASTVSKQHIAC